MKTISMKNSGNQFYEGIYLLLLTNKTKLYRCKYLLAHAPNSD